MSQGTRNPSDSEPQGPKSTRRELLKRLALGLGAAALIQPKGGVLGFGQETKKAQKAKKSKKKKADAPPARRKKGKKKQEPIKKEG